MFLKTNGRRLGYPKNPEKLLKMNRLCVVTREVDEKKEVSAPGLAGWNQRTENPYEEKRATRNLNRRGVLTPMSYSATTKKCEVGERAALPQQGALPQHTFIGRFFFTGDGVSVLPEILDVRELPSPGGE
jgi:hypothetical protein